MVIGRCALRIAQQSRAEHAFNPFHTRDSPIGAKSIH
jgi:hypothetical protein